MKDICDGITVLLVFLGMSLPIIILFLFLFSKKRMEHKQIMAAIEKGIPLPELKPLTSSRRATPACAWIKSLTIGIAFLIFSLPFLFKFLEPFIRRDYVSENALMPFGVFFAVGAAFLIRGLLLRKYQKEHPTDDLKNNRCIKPGTDNSRQNIHIRGTDS